MAWEDRNKAQKRQARREAKEYARTDDDRTYYVTTAGGTRIKAQGINSAGCWPARTARTRRRAGKHEKQG